MTKVTGLRCDDEGRGLKKKKILILVLIALTPRWEGQNFVDKRKHILHCSTRFRILVRTNFSLEID